MAIDQGFDRLFRESPNVANPQGFSDPGADRSPSHDQPAIVPAIAATLFVAIMIAALHMTNQAVVPDKVASNVVIPESAPAKPATKVRIVGVPYVVTPNGQN